MFPAPERIPLAVTLSTDLSLSALPDLNREQDKRRGPGDCNIARAPPMCNVSRITRFTSEKLHFFNVCVRI